MSFYDIILKNKVCVDYTRYVDHSAIIKLEFDHLHQDEVKLSNFEKVKKVVALEDL